MPQHVLSLLVEKDKYRTKLTTHAGVWINSYSPVQKSRRKAQAREDRGKKSLLQRQGVIMRSVILKLTF